MTFRVRQAAAETNPALLNTRLAELRAARLVVVPPMPDAWDGGESLSIN
jgi:hypothetical protein